jgi:hypothetical protein
MHKSTEWCVFLNEVKDFIIEACRTSGKSVVQLLVVRFLAPLGMAGSFFLVPFQYDTMHYSADLEEFLLVMHHLCARVAGNGVILA